MKTFNQLILTLIALALLAGLALAAWFGIEHIGAAFAALDAQVGRVSAIASAVVLLAAYLVASAVRRCGRDRLEVPLREEKAATYRLFVDCWQQRLLGDDRPALEDGLRSLDRLLALFGSEEMASMHMALRNLMRQQSPAKAQWMPMLGGALLQIRKELKAGKVAAGVLESLLAWPTLEPVASTDTQAPSALPAA